MSSVLVVLLLWFESKHNHVMTLYSLGHRENFLEITGYSECHLSQRKFSRDNDNEPLKITSMLDAKRDGRDWGKEKEADRNTDSGSSMAANVI